MSLRYGVVLAITVLAVACGGPSAEPTPSDRPLACETATATASKPSTPTTRDGQRDRIIASLSTQNQTIPPPYNMVVSEDLVVLGDGRVRTRFDGEVKESQLSQAELDALVNELTEADLGRFTDLETPPEVPMGSDTTTLRVDVGEPVEITAYALGEGYPDELVACYQRLMALTRRAGDGVSMPAERVRLYVVPPFGSDLVGPEAPWPEALAVPDGIDTPDDAPPFEAEYDAADAATIIEAFAGEDFAVWTVGTLQYQVAWVPLLL